MSELAAAILAQDPQLNPIFSDKFRHANQWVTFLHQNLTGNPPSVIDRMNTGGWTAETFHAFYVACWVHCPLEKGTFMIPLTGAQLAHAEAGAQTLAKRASSHLSKKGRSAGNENWEFLKGYEELLVQIEEVDSGRPHLMLKAEGHRLNGGIKSFIAHMDSWATKIKTGKGNTANESLNRLAKRSTFGIRERAAENYSKGYEKLLEKMGFSGTLTTVDEAMAKLFDTCAMKANKLGVTARLNALANPYGLRAGLPNGKRLKGMTKGDLAAIITNVIIPSIAVLQEQEGQGKFRKIAGAAVPDLESLAQVLERDAMNPDLANGVRYFEEVRVTAREIDESLTDFYTWLVL